MRFFNKNPVNPDAAIIYVSFILFMLRLYACRFIVPDFNGMDYYGYLELARNIFHKLDFTVRWELDSPIQYPPFFSILIYLLTCLTKNFVTSIQYISIFCASFYLVPLFSLVRNILNVYFAILAAVFTTYYFGIQPCHMLTMDFFYSFLIIIICWLIWDTLTHRNRQAGRYVIAGILISIAYLTKYSGMLFGLASIASILYYFARYQQSLKTGFKYCAFLLLGMAPLFITYHLLLYNNPQREMPGIAAYAFFDGNYEYEKGWDYREEKLSELNSEGTEFAFVSYLKTNNEYNFSLKHPLFVLKKYIWDLSKMTQAMTFRVLPGWNIPKQKFYKISREGTRIFNFLRLGNWNGILREVSSTEVMVNPDIYLNEDVIRKAAGGDFDKVWNILQRSLSLRRNINAVFQGAFLFLLVVSGAYFKWPFNMTHILFYTIGMALIPFYFIDERYLMPFMPLYFILWLIIINSGYFFIKTVIDNKIFPRCLALVFFISFVSIYGGNCNKEIYQRYRYFRNSEEQNAAWLQAASWIKKDSINLPQRAKIMVCSDDYLSYLTDSEYTRLPFVISNWKRVINFAVLKKVNYMVISGDHIDSFLAFSKAAPPNGRIKMIHEISGKYNTFLIFKI